MSILSQLKQLEQDALDGCVECQYFGVCHAINGDINREYIKSWSEFSGDEIYPIFDDTNEEYDTPSDQFSDIHNLWEGEQLNKRLSLLDHLINCYENEGS